MPRIRALPGRVRTVDDNGAMAAALVCTAMVATIVLDQWTKHEARARGVALHNRRGSIAPLSPAAAGVLYALLSAALAAILLTADSLPRLTATALGLAAGGAASNLFDRARLGAVVDFIRIGQWPAFNLADAALTIAVPLCAWSLLR